jgi:hypothetical protein
MNELIANWTKFTCGVCAVIAMIAWGFGTKVSATELLAVLGVLFAVHSSSSGISGFIGGQTQNNAITKTDVTTAILPK